MEYTGSKAFCGRGTQVFIDGIEIDEVTSIEIGPVTRVWMNFVPMSEGQKKVMMAILSGNPVSLTFVCSDVNTTEIIGDSLPIDGNITFPLHDAARMYFEQVHRVVKDRADDGPEVDVINANRDRRILENVMNEIAREKAFDVMLRSYFKSERNAWTEFVERNAGGRFTIVHQFENAEDGCRFHSSKD